LVFGKLMAGRTLAYRSKRLRNSTLIELKPSPTGVVSGDFSATRVRVMESMVAAGSSSPCFSSAARPALGELVLQAALQRIEHPQGGVHDFGADAVAADDRDRRGHKFRGFQTGGRRA
jgi:hypothetical protein